MIQIEFYCITPENVSDNFGIPSAARSMPDEIEKKVIRFLRLLASCPSRIFGWKSSCRQATKTISGLHSGQSISLAIQAIHWLSKSAFLLICRPTGQPAAAQIRSLRICRFSGRSGRPVLLRHLRFLRIVPGHHFLYIRIALEAIPMLPWLFI